MVVTIGTDTTTANVASAIRDAWNATSRLDSEGATDATSNFGGQEFGEYSEVTASIDPDATSVVLLTANRAGYPFTLSVTETTNGDGTATEATSQAATGPYHWDNGDNWSGGSAPANDDVVVFKDNDVHCLFGLPNASKEVTIEQWQSYTGMIGLPATNRWNQSKPYNEYRQRYVRLDDAGTGTDIAHRFGLGQTGSGSPLINLRHATLKCSPIVYNTGTPQIPGIKALNICCTANTSTINILNGSVDFSSQDSSTSAFLTARQTGGDSRGVTAIHTSGSLVEIQGGTMLLGGAGAIVAIVVGSASSASLRLESQTGTITGLSVKKNGTVDYASTATITTLTIYDGGLFDSRSSAGGFTVATGKVYSGGKFLDPYSRMTVGTDFLLYYDPSPELVFGADEDTPLSIVFN